MPRPNSASASKISAGATLGDTVRYVGVVALVGMVLATVFTAWQPSLKPGSLLAGFVPPTATPEVITETVAALTPTAEAPTSFRIGIVAGHKGKTGDPGAVCADGLTEASVNLDIAQRVQAGLQASGFQVDLLDEFDSRLSDYDALALVSIHNDSCEYINDAATGFKVAGAVNTGVRDKSEHLVACLSDRYARRTGLKFHTHSVTPDMTNYHTFYEVKPSTPVAIIETGFLNLDRKILTEEPFKVAQGVIEGILCYVTNQPVPPTPTPAP